MKHTTIRGWSRICQSVLVCRHPEGMIVFSAVEVYCMSALQHSTVDNQPRLCSVPGTYELAGVGCERQASLGEHGSAKRYLQWEAKTPILADKDKIPLYMVCAFSLFHYTAIAVARNFIPLHTEALGAAPHITGAVVATFAFLPLFLSIPGGSIVDRVGARNVATVAGIFMMLAALILVLVPRIAFVAVAQVFLGLAHVLVAISTQSYVSKIGRTHERANNFGFYSFITSVGFMLGPLIGGALADMWSFGATFAGAGVLSLGTTIFASRLPPPNNAASKKQGQPSATRSLRSVLREGQQLMKGTAARLSVFVSMCALFALAIRTSFYPVYLEQIGYSAGPIGVLISIQAGVGMFLRPMIGTLLRRFHVMNLLISALLVGAVGLIFTPLMLDFAPLVALAILAGVTTSLTQPISMILMAEGSREEQRGVAMSLRLTGNRLVMLVGPAGLGLIASLLGVHFCFVLSSGILVAAAIVLALWGRRGASGIRIEAG